MSEHKLKLTPVVMRREESLARTHKPQFARLRQMLFKKHGQRCSICGASDGVKIEAHEVWLYEVEEWDPDARKTLWFVLDDIVPVCLPCHHVIHTGWGPRNSKQFCRVNKCTDIEYREALAECGAERAKLYELEERCRKENWYRRIDYCAFARGEWHPDEDYDPWNSTPWEDDDEPPYGWTPGGTPIYEM